MKPREGMSARSAAIKVLQDAGQPLHYQEIAKRVLSRGLWQTKGKTPAATISAQLAGDIKRKGDASAFRRGGRGIFTLNPERPVSASPPAAKPKRQEKRTRRSRPLVLGYLERIASSAFSEFPQQITDLVHGKHGVYALYKGDRLYYVGLATNLRNRIKQHLNDKHAGKWNRFSLYLVRKAEHIKELEAMILRIADPKGNSMRGALPGAEDLFGELDKSIRKKQERQRQILFGIKHRTRPKRKRKPNAVPRQRGDKVPALAPLVSGQFQIKRTYKGKEYKATVLADGRVRFNGGIYNSPSAAGIAAKGGKATNGWTFWSYQDPSGNWVKLDSLRK